MTASSTHHWTFKRNCSITPRQLAAFYASLACVSLGIATMFWLQGVKMVMPFAWLELLALGTALMVYARHAMDKEEISLNAQQLQVQWQDGSKVHSKRFDTRWLRVQQLPTQPGGLIQLQCKDETFAIGRFLRPSQRALVTKELRAALGMQERCPGAASV
jgi:uncharacterized membrane protein